MPEMAKVAKIAKTFFREVRLIRFGKDYVIVLLRCGKQLKIDVDAFEKGKVLEFKPKKEKAKSQAP